MRDLLRNNPPPGGARDEVHPLDGGGAAPETPSEPRYVLDDEVPVSGEAPTGCVIIERHYDLDLQHGSRSVGHYAGVVERCLPALAVLAADQKAAGVPGVERPRRLEFDGAKAWKDERVRPGVPARGPLLFFDLETTGLSGGAGTLAFLVGCGFFDNAGFHTRQYFLAGYEAEHELLQALAALTGEFGGLVTFNGRTFDVPLIETRYLFHRLPSPFGELPHFDMLHPARRLWRRRREGEAEQGSVAASRDGWSETVSDRSSCALGALEEAILGVIRHDDVPGAEIPSRYFHYLRTGDMDPLQAVFEHNRLDLISLAALTAMGMRIVEDGPANIPSAHEALAMGQLYAVLGRTEQAEACFARAAGLERAPGEPQRVDGMIRGEALRRLALQRRRQRRYDDAADAWRGMLESGVPQALTQEARRALAIHHEHRARDLEQARAIAERALASERDPKEIDALRHRLARLDRKLGRAPG